jgi:transmembrane sensor
MKSREQKISLYEQESASWVLKVHQGLSSSQQQQLQHWLKNDERKVIFEEMLRVERSIMGFSTEQVSHLLAQADTLSGRDKIKSSNISNWFAFKKLVPRMSVIAACTAVVMLSINLLSVEFFNGQKTNFNKTYITHKGDFVEHKLPDGSIVKLDSMSTLNVDFSQRQRKVTLLSGRALFDVANINNQPFIVKTGMSEVTVLGTQFSVREFGDSTRVSVKEGRVSVKDLHKGNIDSSQTAILHAGQSVHSGKLNNIKAISPNLVGSWLEGRLVFDNQPLSVVITEVNRYNDTQYVIAGDELESMPLTGTFNLSELSSFEKLLVMILPVEISEKHGQSSVKIKNQSDSQHKNIKNQIVKYIHLK